MGLRVKFSVDPTAVEKMDKQLISNDLGGRERIQWMVFKLGNESWELVAEGKPGSNWFKKMISHCKDGEGAHLIFRSADGNTDVWIKFIPDTANIKAKTYFATASDSLFDDTRGAKHKLEIRDLAELDASNPILAPYV